jgi:hypothetical protein
MAEFGKFMEVTNFHYASSDSAGAAPLVAALPEMADEPRARWKRSNSAPQAIARQLAAAFPPSACSPFTPRN